MPLFLRLFFKINLVGVNCYDRRLGIRNVGSYLHENFTEYTEFTP